jgi:UDP-N-acetylmuramyl pentapeptide synthase
MMPTTVVAIYCLEDAAQAADTVPGLLVAGDLVLVKGSLGVGLARVCEVLGARVK